MNTHLVLLQVFLQLLKDLETMAGQQPVVILEATGHYHEAVLSAGEAKLTERITVICASRSEKWAKEKAQNLLAAELRNPFRKVPYQSHLFSMNMYISMLLHYKEHLLTLEKQIDALANEVDEYEIIQTIPASEKKSRQRLSLKLVKIDRFNHPKKLVAFVGIDPSVHISGYNWQTNETRRKLSNSALEGYLACSVISIASSSLLLLKSLDKILAGLA
jgi:transposase